MVSKLMAVVLLAGLALAAMPALAQVLRAAAQEKSFAAYLGSTQASSIANPPVLIAGILGASPDVRITGGTTLLAFNNYNRSSTVAGTPGANAGGRLWSYFTTDVTTGVLASGYFTDAGPLGMRPFDVVMIAACGTSNSSASVLRFAHVWSISTAGAAVLSTGINITT